MALAAVSGLTGMSLGTGQGTDEHAPASAALPPFPFPGTPYALYSTAKVNLSATKSFQAIRTSDSATQDIGFVGGVADAASLVSFCANTTCQAKLYDQSGNARDCVVDGTTPLPWAIAKNGRIWFSVVDNRPSICMTAAAFTATGDQTLGMGGVVIGTDIVAAPFANYDGTNGWFLTFNGAGTQGYGAHPGQVSYFSVTGGEYLVSGSLYTQQNAVAFTRASGTVTPYVNGSAGAPTAGFGNSNASDGATLGAFNFSAHFPSAGLFSEVYYYTSALTPTQVASIQTHEAAVWPDNGFGTPSTGSASVQFSVGNTVNGGVSEALVLGNVLQYEYTQPWTTFVAAQIYGIPTNGGAGIFFTNVTAPANPAFPGYEFWMNDVCHLRVEIIHDISANQAAVAEGTTQVCDFTKHVFGATYDGSGTAAGLHLYIDGNPEPSTTVMDGLGGGTIISAGQSFYIGNQQGVSFNLSGTMNVFRQDNVARNAAYMLAHATPSSLLTGDGSTALLLPINGGSGTTVSDTSGHGLNGTLTSATQWVH